MNKMVNCVNYEKKENGSGGTWKRDPTKKAAF